MIRPEDLEHPDPTDLANRIEPCVLEEETEQDDEPMISPAEPPAGESDATDRPSTER